MMLKTAEKKIPAMFGKLRGGMCPFAFSLAVMLFLLSGGATLHVSPAYAQQGSAAEITALRREVDALRRAVADLQTAPGSGGAGNAAVADLQIRTQQIFEQFRTMTGNQERLENRVRKLEERLDKLITDIDFRLRDIEANAQPAAADNEAADFAPAAPGDEDDLSRPVAPGMDGGARPRDILFPADADAEAEPSATAAPAPMPESDAEPVAEDPKAQYQAALALVNNRDFEAAEEALQQFAAQHSGHPLVGNALYWLGETFYARQRYQEAARVFGEAYVTNRGGVKAAHSLLKLAMSLDRLGRDGDACTTYAELLNKHGDAEPRTLKYAQDARKRLSCP